MAISGIRKAAMLLMSLDPTTAGELLKGLAPETVTSIAVELAYLDASGFKAQDSAAISMEFFSSLHKKKEAGIKLFLSRMLESSVGAKKSQEIQAQIAELVKRRDPFIDIRAMEPAKLIPALEGEHPQAVAMVLAELPPKRSTEILSKLSEQLRFKTVKRMTNPEYISPDAKVRIANVILKKLQPAPAAPGAVVAAAVAAPSASEQSKAALRRLAIMLRGLAKELRDGLVEAIKSQNAEAAEGVMTLMVTWEDIVLVADRPLQEALRGVDSQKLARALVKAENAIAAKIRANISERARALLDEETQLMSAPKPEEIAAAREDFVNILRELNAKGELTFIEE